jgi:hypothetical protein
MDKQELDALRKQAAITAAAHGCKANLQVIGFPAQESSAVTLKIVVTRALSASKRLKREVEVRLGDVGASAAVENIVRDIAEQMSKE